MFMRKKMREWLASQLSVRSEFVEEKIARLLRVGLLSDKDASEIRKGAKDPAKPTIAPSRWMYWNVHLDGLERTHDLIVEREGVFKECILAIKMAKVLGYQVATNTTVYKETDMQEDPANVRLSFRPRCRWPYHHSRLRLRRGEERHD